MLNRPANFHVTRWNSEQGPSHGYWGEPTASIDWCEVNYEVTRYIAEFANTLSNLAFILLAFYGYRKSQQEQLPFSLTLCHLGVAAVGLGSFWFHATLSYEAQLADELPMIYFSSVITYVSFDVKKRRSAFVKALPFLLAFVDFAVTAIYMVYPNPVFHQTAYALIQLVTTVQVSYLLHIVPWKNKKRRREIVWIEAIGSVSFLTGFLIWNLDNNFCDTITQWKKQLGLPTAFLLEGHAWWHLGTGIGAYWILVGIQMIALCFKDRVEDYEFRWGLGGTTPYVARVRGAKKAQ